MKALLFNLPLLFFLSLCCFACQKPSLEDISSAPRIETATSLERANEILHSSFWQEKTHKPEPAGFSKSELLMISAFPKAGAALEHVGWVECWKPAQSQFGYCIFLDTKWRVLSFMELEQEVSLKEGGITHNLPLVMKVKELYGGSARVGIDSLRYDRSTLLKQQTDWASESSKSRGIMLQEFYPEVKLQRLNSLAKVEAAAQELEKENFYELQDQLSEALRRESAGDLRDVRKEILEQLQELEAEQK